jgi:PAS domain S-box-containing protein
VKLESINPSSPFAVVVNDDPTQLRVLCGLIRKAGLEPRGFPGAEAALADMSAGAGKAESGPAALPALVITDLYMPGIDGWRFCRLLRSPEYAAFNQVPILVFSATFSGEDASRIAADLGAEAFLTSPVDGQRFCEQVRAILSGERARNPVRVLIVDDNAALCGLLTEVLANRGYEVETALSARAAAQAFSKSSYDVAILDYHLPDGSGDALLDDFRAKRPDCVCLMITSDASPELALEWMKRGAAAHLRKPFKPEYLIELCARARRERALLHAQDLLEVRTRELRHSEEQHRSLLEQLRIGIVVHAPDTSIQFSNQEALRMLGLSAEQMHGKTAIDPAWRFVREDGSAMALEDYPANRALASLQPVQDYIAGVDRPATGDRAWVLVRAHPAFGPKQELLYIVVTFVDITESKRAAAEKAELETQFQQAQKMESVGRLAGGVAHDFNNMLQAILGNVHLAMAGIPPVSAARENLEEIQKCAQRSAELTRQLLTFARKQTIAPKVLDLNETVESSLKMLRRLIGENIDLAWLPAAGLGSVKIDPTQVDQILANLCVNARDAIGGVGRVTIATANSTFDEAHCAAHPESQPGEYVWLAVRDDGCGMNQDTLAHIFEPFFTTKDVGEGTGLGLATIYGIVKQNSGFVSVDSEPGQGTIFNIYLPRHASQAPAIERERVAEPAESRGETVLIVEDEPAILAISRRVLERLGYTVLTAGTPAEAIRLAGAHTSEIQLVMTDVVMPEMNGWDLARRLLSLHPKLKCLFMSGYTADIIAHDGVLDDGVHFIQKPFSMGDLAAKVRSVLDSLGGT